MDNSASDISDRMADIAKDLVSCRNAFIALGDENRQLIIMALLEQYGGMRVGEMTAKTNLSRPAVSHHPKVLKDAGIVNTFKQGTMNFYHVDANESQWEQITSLITRINERVIEVSERRQNDTYRADIANY